MSADAVESTPPASRSRARPSLKPALPASTWVLLGGYSLSSVGTGFVLPFNAIFLHSFRHLPLLIVGAVFAVIAAAALVVTPLAGRLTDSLGPRMVLAAASLVQAVGWAGLLLSRSPGTALAAAAAVGVGNGLFYPALTPMIARLTPAARRSDAFALRYLVTNAGIAIGALLGGLLTAGGSFAAFAALYLVDVASFLGFGLLMLLLPAAVQAPRTMESARAPARAAGGYARALADRTLLALLGLYLLIVTFGYAQLDSSLPLYARTALHVSLPVLGLGFAANTITVVLLQWPLAQLTAAWRRTRLLLTLGLAWTAAWLMVWTAARPGVLRADVLLVAFFIAFGVGECLVSPSFPTLVTAIAPPGCLGRYTALVSMTWSVGSMVGPGLGVWAVGSPYRGAVWLGFAVSAMAVSLIALALERSTLNSSLSQGLSSA